MLQVEAHHTKDRNRNGKIQYVKWDSYILVHTVYARFVPPSTSPDFGPFSQMVCTLKPVHRRPFFVQTKKSFAPKKGAYMAIQQKAQGQGNNGRSKPWKATPKSGWGSGGAKLAERVPTQVKPRAFSPSLSIFSLFLGAFHSPQGTQNSSEG